MQVSLVLGLILCLIIFVAVIAFLLIKRNIRSQTENSNRNQEYIRMSSELMRKVRDKTQNKLLHKKAEEIYDLLQASPHQSREDIKVTEEEILNKLSFLDIYISEENDEMIEAKLDEIQKLIQYRNESLK